MEGNLWQFCAMAGTGWTKSETQTLLHVWSDQSIQFKLKTVSKNPKIYEAIAHSLMNVVMKRQEGQSKTNMKNLIAKIERS